VVKLAGTNKTGGGVKYCLQAAGDVSIRHIIVNACRKAAARVRRVSYTLKLPELVEAATDNVPDVLIH